jgi:homoserine O-acetyltransferase/O-succinyltransferase
MEKHLFKYNFKFSLESGASLANLELSYCTFGQLNDKQDNVIWICHALTANADASDWWQGLVGENDLFNPRDYFIVCANVLTSPYGSSSPLTLNPKKGKPYYHDFPQVTVRDMVRAHELLRNHLGIRQVHLLIGGSLGGQQAMEWAILRPDVFQNLILLATNARHSPWGIAFNESQRMAIEADPTWKDARPDAGQAGLKAARAMALLSYRNGQTYNRTQSENEVEKRDDFRASSYQQYQGQKLVNRFNAQCYYLLSKAMDSHNVGRGRGTVEEALLRIKANTLVVGISSDILFPPQEQQFLAKHITKAQYVEIDSPYGHDGFLVEHEQISTLIRSFLSPVSSDRRKPQCTPSSGERVGGRMS